MKLHKHQTRALAQCIRSLKENKACYLAGDLRTGKTLVALSCASEFGTNVLFVTKKMAIPAISEQYDASGFKFKLLITNYEQLEHLDPVFDFIIIDEAHTLGAFPKPSKRARRIRFLSQDTPVLLLSGTPSPESYSQLFHQLWAARWEPWLSCRNFYKWARDFVNIRKKYLGPIPFNDYTDARWDKIEPVIKPIMVTMTQKDAGFKGTVLEQVHTIPLLPATTKAIKQVLKDGVYDKLKLAALSGAQRMSYVHQLCSGTVIDSEDRSRIIDRSKANYIIKTWCINISIRNPRLAIFYCFIQEGVLLREYFPHNTNDPEEFAKDKRTTFICQIKSGSEGTDLREADVLIFYNISHSAASYFQARARQQHREAKDVTVHWLFSDQGYEKSVYKIIHNGKKKYTLAHFREDFSIPNGAKVTFRGMARNKDDVRISGRRT